MGISYNEKYYNVEVILGLIRGCKTEDDIERIDQMIDEHMREGYIFKKDYELLTNELEKQNTYIAEH